MRNIAANNRLRYTALRDGPSRSKDRYATRLLQIINILTNRSLTAWPKIHEHNEP
jgi:hypothetical protein